VISALHSRHRAIEFKKFLQTIDREVPDHLDVHLVLDNSSTHTTPAIKRWLAAHPRFHLHFTPTSSPWLNLVERWFAELTTKLLRRGAHRSVRQLNTDIRAWIKPGTRTPSRSSGPRPPNRSSNRDRPLLPTNQSIRTLDLLLLGECERRPFDRARSLWTISEHGVGMATDDRNRRRLRARRD
jgi:transposase